MLSNAYLLAKFRFDTAENERNFVENLRKIDTSPPHRGRPGPGAGQGGRRRPEGEGAWAQRPVKSASGSAASKL